MNLLHWQGIENLSLGEQGYWIPTTDFFRACRIVNFFGSQSPILRLQQLGFGSLGVGNGRALTGVVREKGSDVFMQRAVSKPYCLD